MTTVLITGANKGLGAESARRLAGLGWTVWMGARSLTSAESAATAIRAEQPDADLRPLRLDVTDQATVDAAYATVRAAGTGLDVLVNNAGIADPRGYDTLTTRAEDLDATYAVNVAGPVRVTHAFLPLLQSSARPRLVMVSSGLGGIDHVNDPERIEFGVPGFVYQSSKAALDMIASQYRKALPAFRVCSVDPGYTATDLNGHQGHQSVTEGTDTTVAAASWDEVPGWRFGREDLAVGARS
jgi:NAD(P)-dependent dehydrogenase (short-subunit alcohol dehydrogenase family)